MSAGREDSGGVVPKEPVARTDRAAQADPRDRIKQTVLRLHAHSRGIAPRRLASQQEAVPRDVSARMTPVRMRARRRKSFSLHRGLAPRPVAANERWSMGLVHDQLADRRAGREMTVVENRSRESVLPETDSGRPARLWRRS